MKPFYASALVFFMACSLWFVADSPHQRDIATMGYANVGFGSMGSLRH